MKLKYLFAIICASLLLKTKSQTYAASNFTMISLLNPEVGVNIYNDKYSACWGWFQQSTNKEYAIACSKSGTYWVDVTNPATPTVSAFAAGTSSNGVWRETKTYQNYCYVACDDNSSSGFQIFDMSTLPSTVTLKYQGNSYFKRGHTLWVDGNKLYVAGITYSNNTTSSMNVYSLATPTAPVLLRQLKQDYSFISYVHDMYVRNDTVYASCGNQGLYVFKFNTGSNTFTQLGSLTTYSSSGYNHSSCLTPNGQTLVFTDEVPAGLPFKTANVSNLSNIQVLATANQFSQGTPHNVFVVNNQYVFLSSYQDGTQLYDISSPSTPTLAGFFDTFPQGGGNNNNWTGDDYDGQWGLYPYFPSKNIFALDQKNGMFMLKTHLYQNAAVINPTVSFTSPSTVCAGSSVSFTNTSQGAATYTWTFAGGNPGTSNATNPSVTYSVAGTYSVTLQATGSATPAGTASSSGTIVVKQVQATITFTNASCSTCSNGAASATPSAGTAPYSYTWIPSGGNAATASNLSPGCYTVNITDATMCSASKTVCVGFVSGINANRLETKALVYPNPAGNEVNIEVSGEKFDYSIYNSLGELMRHDTSIANKCSLNLGNYSKGVYLVEIEAENIIIHKKLIIK
jgi:choice-of-anchor B domain-containing protein